MKSSIWSHNPPEKTHETFIQSIRKIGDSVHIILKRKEQDGRFRRMRLRLDVPETLSLVEELQGLVRTRPEPLPVDPEFLKSRLPASVFDTLSTPDNDDDPSGKGDTQ